MFSILQFTCTPKNPPFFLFICTNNLLLKPINHSYLSTFNSVLQIRDVYPGSDVYPSRISDPKTAKREGWKKKLFILFCSHKFHKIKFYFVFEMLKKKSLTKFQRIIEVFTQKIITKLSKIWVWDPGSEIRDQEKTYSGSRGQKGTGSRIRNTALIENFWALTRAEMRATAAKTPKRMPMMRASSSMASAFSSSSSTASSALTPLSSGTSPDPSPTAK